MSEKIPLVDGHAHLDELDDLSQILLEARASGVVGIIAVGMDLDSNMRTLEIAQANPGYVHPALGYHPWEIKKERMGDVLSFIRSHILESIALGEIGLDYKTKVKKELQWRVFGDLLDMACQYDKPVIIHCRYSHQRALEMVMERQVKRAVFHWYTGPLDLLEKILKNGYFISATPALAYSPPHREAIRNSPLEYILLETDTPVSYRGMAARPKDIRITLEEVARLKGLDPRDVATQTTSNASLVFHIPLGS
jgi:TatD DNase family protein